MASLAVLVRTAPYGALEAAEGVRHLAGRKALGFEEALGVFCDDGVWTLAAGQRTVEGFNSLEPSLKKVAGEGVPLLCERASLEQRGIGHGELVDLMMATGRILGSF